ncbi:DUF4179 domain-containing protein [Niallia sp. JL1B1071]|uniref:DUF4179 domain-containing protein n=1 Tax=Niallia tiangongensis TaxID=3237105 RepID=UPI0037DDC01A
MTDHFDKKLKAMVKDEYTIPEQLENKINETLANLPSQKMNGKKKRMIISTAAAAILVLSIASLQMNPSLAQNIGIPSYVEKFLLFGNDYEKVSLQTNEVQESKGVKLTITNTIFDGYYLMVLMVSYKAEQKEPYKKAPILFPQNAKIVAGDKGSFVSVSNEYGDFEDKNKTVYNGVTVFPLNKGSFDFNHEIDSEEKFIEENKLDIYNLPKTFNLQFNLEELGLDNGSKNSKIKGNWEFNLPVETVQATENSKTIDLNKRLPAIGENVTVEKLIITPIRVYIQGLQGARKGILTYVMKDDSGETKNDLGGSVYVNDNGSKRFLSNYENNNPSMKSLTIVPVEYHKEPHIITTSNSTKFNSNGEQICQ